MVQAAPPPDSGQLEPSGVPRAGDVVSGKYEVERLIGIGGMGAVASARHIQLSQRVAIKFLLPEAAAQPEARARFLREAQAASAIESEHVARVIDVGALEGGAPYMVMEFLSGRDLSQVLKLAGQRPTLEAVDYVLQACDAIAQAHVLGIVHRDLKPSNLFLTQRPDGRPLIKVLDFGISKMVSGAGPQPNLTATSFSFGTPVYMSPEQIRSTKNVDPRTDIWALGVILHELLTGRPPFEAEALPALCAMITADPPMLVRAGAPSTPAGLEAVILRCLEKDVSRRYQSVGDLAAALAPFAPPGAQALVPRILALSASGSPASMPGLASLSLDQRPTASPWEAGRVGGASNRKLVVATAGFTLAAALLAAGGLALFAPSAPAAGAAISVTPVASSVSASAASSAPLAATAPEATATPAPEQSSAPVASATAPTKSPRNGARHVAPRRREDVLGDRH
jgi:eukaryotic-like serine/threonine-protein kinase